MSDQIRILSHLRSHQDEMVKLLEVFTNTDSPSTDKPLLDAFADLLARQWQDLGARVTILEQAKQGNHVKVEVGSGDKTILLLCHFDTVWNAGETKKRPFRVEDGKAYGPGVYDMKAGIVQSIFAVKTLKDLGLLPDKRIVILNNSDEEIGSHSSRAIIEEEAKKASAVLVLEPSALSGSLKTWRKGVGTFKVFNQGARFSRRRRLRKRSLRDNRSRPSSAETARFHRLGSGHNRQRGRHKGRDQIQCSGRTSRARCGPAGQDHGRSQDNGS